MHFRSLKSDVQPQAFDQHLSYPPEHGWNRAFRDMGVAAAQLALDGSLLAVNHWLGEVIGYPETHLLGKNFSEFFQSGGAHSEYDNFRARLIAGEISNYSTELYVQRADGQVVWLNTIFSLLRSDSGDIPDSLILVAQDVSSLRQAREELREAQVARHELSSRMMGAQESDRTRIARELHDDIGQSLAILKMQMLRSGQPVSGEPKRTHADLKELTEKLDTIIQRVSHLSHGLHSSELEFMGLAIALQSHCRESSEQLRIPIQCHCDEVEKTLDGLVGLAFLRVLQEALHNAAKHSGAGNIMVRLNGSKASLSLEISDDGVGFDLEAKRLAAGLGLISMRERMHLIGGEFDIFSSPGRGTRIMARAPITKSASST